MEAKMGGYGSGRYFYYSGKSTTNDYLAIDIRKWGKKVLSEGNAFSCSWSRYGEQVSSISVNVGYNVVILRYKNREGASWKEYNYPVHITYTTCEYGGSRPWFICPTVGCGKRVAIIYGGDIFACRHCYKLAYKSQRESESDRACRKADKIRDKLDWEPGILNGEGLKPKGMHWKTFERMLLQHEKFAYLTLSHLENKYKFREKLFKDRI